MRYKCKVPSFPVPRVKKREHSEAIAAKKSDAARGNLALVCLWACSRLRIWAWTFFRLLDQHFFFLHIYVLSLRYAFRFINRGMRKGKKKSFWIAFRRGWCFMLAASSISFSSTRGNWKAPPFPPPCEPEIQFCSSQFWSLFSSSFSQLNGKWACQACCRSCVGHFDWNPSRNGFLVGAKYVTICMYQYWPLSLFVPFKTQGAVAE